MTMTDNLQIRKRSVYAFLQLGLVLFCLVYLRYVYLQNIIPDREIKVSHQSSRCLVLSKKLSSQGWLIKRYRADFFLSYQVARVPYTRWVSANGLDNSFSSDASAEEDILSQYDVGQTYHCWIHPQNAQRIILVARHHWLSINSIVLPSVVGLVSLFLLLKNVYWLILAVRINLSKIRLSKKIKDHERKKRTHNHR